MENYCKYCSLLFASGAELAAHCNSEAHQLVIMNDEGREWKFRVPARGGGSDQYTLCTSFSNTGKCRLGEVCCDAHGEEELAEWKERFEFRQMKLQQAKDNQLQGRNYTEQLLEKWLTAPNPSLIMADHVSSVVVNVEPETNLTVSEKNCCREWTFHLSTKASLRHVALLYETHRNHFKISYLEAAHAPTYDLGQNCQEWSNSDHGAYGDENYTIKVRFMTAIYGTFRQDLVFDFGFEPVLVKKLCVDVVSISDMEKLQQARETVISFTERWSSSDVVTVPFLNRPHALGEQEQNLLELYPPPTGNKFTLTHSVMESTLTEDNYNARQHELLCIEEMAQYDLLSRYNVQAELSIADRYLLTPNSAVTAKYAQNGELFANMTLSSVLSEDSSSGRLVLQNCNTVLIAPVKTKGKENRKVYEAVIEDKGKTVIYIRLSKQCCQELNLKPEREFQAEVQFQLNRLPLCEMHFAVDRLHPPALVFPDISRQTQLQDNHLSLSPDLKLNPKQKEAILAITTPLSERLPPVLIIGPFGTGKTYTLAQAVKILASQDNTRILVCTHSNSAADIYIREYLHPYHINHPSEGKESSAPLRIYYRHRWVATVNQTVQQYCLINYSGGSERSFLMPTLSDLRKHKVVVTTLSTARYLVQLGLEKGFFTHILIDEAAQAMECEAIMPLSLANENTRIVLAGDHMQLSPEIYSEFAQQRNLHTSLLERLYDLYPEQFSCKVLLSENYRSHEAIIQYTSELFYDNHLKASVLQPRHTKYYPLTFFTAMGEDVQDCNSTAFHNYAEVNEIVERVIELKKNWPTYWGDQDETSIGVVTPYYDQVVRIRAELRKKKLHGVSVERVLNVQGKQFRVIFLSAVRTRQTCGAKSKPESDLDHGFLSNARLLNTAITRAQSLVAVVGDPVSLCSVGKCRKLWEKFIFTCHKENSLFGMTWDYLRSQLDSMELKKNFILNPLAIEFVPGRMFHGDPNVLPPNENCVPFTQKYNEPVYNGWPNYLSAFQGMPVIQPALLPCLEMSPRPRFQQQNYFPKQHKQMWPSGQLMPNSPLLPNPIRHPPPPQFVPHSSLLPQRPAPYLASKFKEAENVLIVPKVPQESSVLPVKKYDNATPVYKGLYLPMPSGRSMEEPNQTAIKKYDTPSYHAPGAPVVKAPGIIPMMMDHNQSKSEDLKRPKPEGIPPGKVEDLYCNGRNNINMDEKFPLKVDELPHKNGYNEFGFHMFSEQQQQQSTVLPQSNGIWSPLQRPHFEVDPTEDLGLRKMNFGEVNGFGHDTDRFAPSFEAPNHSPLMLPHANVNELFPGTHIAENPLINVQVIQNSLMDKLNLLHKVLPPGTDVHDFLNNEDHTRNFLQFLLQNEGAPAAKTFLLLLASIKKDQEIVREANMQVALKKMANRRFGSAMDAPRNMSPLPMPRHLTNNSESLGSDGLMSPFSMPHLFPDSGMLRHSEPNRHLPVRLDNHHWPPVNSIGQRRPTMEPPVFDMSKLSLGSPVDVRMTNGGPVHNSDSFLHSSFNNTPQHFEREQRSDNGLQRMWSAPVLKTTPVMKAEDGWPRNPPVFNEPPSSQASYLSRLRNISQSVEAEDRKQSFPFDIRADDKSVNNSSGHITAGPLSMSYPDIPDLLSALSPDNESSKVIRKPTQRMSEVPPNNPTSPFLFDIRPTSDTSMRYPPMSSEGMTYAKILRSPQH